MGIGSPDAIEFKVTGKEILDPGWRAVYAKDAKTDDAEAGNQSPATAEGLGEASERTLPSFQKGESGPHVPTLTEKMTTPPPYYTEATLLRAMETAGKLVDDEELRAALKENGIGRPSTRAAIIETLFKRHYIRRERKRLVATPTGIELIDLIREDLLKSAELTGIWEKKLRDIERDKTSYQREAQEFIDGLKQQVTDIVHQVMADASNRRVTIVEEDPARSAKPAANTPSTSTASKPRKPRTKKAGAAAPTPQTSQQPNAQTSPSPREGDVCPLCGQGRIIRGKTAFGCSRWREGCTYRVPFE